MGEIVAAFATCHAPQLIIRPPDEKPEQLDASIAAMRELGKILDETKPDVILFLGSDHLETFSMSCVPTFCIIAGNRANAEFGGRNYDLPVHREMAEDLLNKLVRADFDVSYSEDAILGHTFAVPFEYVIDKRNIPIVPIHTNVYMPPLPSAKRCAAFGKAMADIIKSRPERVCVIASGGMSHYPGTKKYPNPEFDFDYWMIAQLESGNIDALLDMTAEQLDETGNTELLTWAMMFGMIGSVPGELVQYTPTWHHGHGYMRFLPARPRKNPAVKADKPYGGFEFKNAGFEFYKHTPASAFNLNRFLFQVRTNDGTRQEVIANLDKLADEYQLKPEERKAVHALIDVGGGKVVSDFAKPLVDVGAHPLQALMTLHAMFPVSRKALQDAQNKPEKKN